MKRPEYIILGVLLFAGLFAFPQFRDVQALQNLGIAICTGLGIPVGK
jgi:hypothetical protein